MSKRRRNRRREDDYYEEEEELDRAELKRRRKNERRKKAVRRMRKAMAVLVLILIVALIIFLTKHKKDGDTEETTENATVNYDGQGLMNVGEASAFESLTSDKDTLSEDSVTAQIRTVMADGVYEGAVDINTLIQPGAALDVTTGQAAVDLTNVDRENRVASAKAAMKNMSFFTGSRKLVDACLGSYGEGEWYGIRDVTGELRIFYEGIHRQEEHYISGEDGEEHTKPIEVPFKVVFTVFEDGSFSVKQVIENGETVEDWKTWLENLVNS